MRDYEILTELRNEIESFQANLDGAYANILGEKKSKVDAKRKYLAVMFARGTPRGPLYGGKEDNYFTPAVIEKGKELKVSCLIIFTPEGVKYHSKWSYKKHKYLQMWIHEDAHFVSYALEEYPRLIASSLLLRLMKENHTFSESFLYLMSSALNHDEEGVVAWLTSNIQKELGLELRACISNEKIEMMKNNLHYKYLKSLSRNDALSKIENWIENPGYKEEHFEDLIDKFKRIKIKHVTPNDDIIKKTGLKVVDVIRW